MAEKERIGRTVAKTLSVGGVAVPKIAAGTATVTGSGTVTPAGFNSITSVVATLGVDAALAGLVVSATWSGTVVTLKVWKPTATGDVTPIAATVAKVVNYAIFGA